VIDGTIPDPGFLQLDPLSGLIALSYPLPSLVVNGDVGVMEANGQILSDGIRFEDINGVSFLFFFSGAGDSDLADTGIPQGNFQNFFVTENLDRSFVYIAGVNSYFGLSDGDAVPNRVRCSCWAAES
jgi:hypothetical protein